MANLLQLRARARLKASVASADFSNANLDDQINEAYYALASILAEIGETYTDGNRIRINLAQNSAYYNLPSDFIKLKQARIAYSAPTNPEDWKVAYSYDVSEVSDVERDEENISTSHPIIEITGTKIKVKPTPSSAVTNGLELFYISRPSALTLTGDTPSLLPTHFHDLISVYAAREMSIRFAKITKYNLLDKAWNEGVLRMKRELADRDANRPLRFKNPFMGVTPGQRFNVTELGN